MIISMLVTVGVNAILTLLSSGSMELMWSFLNVVQVMNYIPILSLNIPNIVSMLFDYLKIANSDVTLFQQWFFYLFNLREDTFVGDHAINENFKNSGFKSMRFVLNYGSQLAIILTFLILWTVLVIAKNIAKRCFKR